MDLDHIAEAMVARGLVALTMVKVSDGWQLSARSEGSGWSVGLGATPQAAFHHLMEQPARVAWKGKTLYWRREDGLLMVTYNGQPPRAADGDFRPIAAAEWLEATREKPIYDDILGDLL